MIRRVINITTDSSGDCTAYGEAAVGVLYAVQEVDGDLADGVDLTLTSEEENLSIPLLTHANFNSDGMVFPRVLENLNTDGTALTTHCMPVVFGMPKAVIAQGGSTKSGKIVLYILEV